MLCHQDRLAYGVSKCRIKCDRIAFFKPWESKLVEKNNYESHESASNYGKVKKKTCCQFSVFLKAFVSNRFALFI